MHLITVWSRMVVLERLMVIGLVLAGQLIMTGCTVTGGFTIGPIPSGSSGGGASTLPSVGPTKTPAASKIIRSVAIPSFSGVGNDGTPEGLLMIGDNEHRLPLLSGATLDEATSIAEQVGRELILQPEHSTALYNVYFITFKGVRLPTPYLYFKNGVFVGYVPQI